METEFAGPPLPPQFIQRFEYEIRSSPNSKQYERVPAAKLKKHSDKRKHKVQAKYITSSSSSEESEPSVQVKESSKPKGASSEQDNQKSDPDPVFYREVDMSDRHGYEKTCDYLHILNKRILIQQRALACQSKALAHILQREMYTMSNSILIRREPEMTHLQPHLGAVRRQELRSSPFWPTPLFLSQLVKDGEDFLLKKGTPKDTQGFGPIKTSLFMVPTTIRKEAPSGNVPMGGGGAVHSKQ